MCQSVWVSRRSLRAPRFFLVTTARGSCRQGTRRAPISESARRKKSSVPRPRESLRPRRPPEMRTAGAPRGRAARRMSRQSRIARREPPADCRRPSCRARRESTDTAAPGRTRPGQSTRRRRCAAPTRHRRANRPSVTRRTAPTESARRERSGDRARAERSRAPSARRVSVTNLGPPVRVC